MILAKLDVTKIDKAKLFRGKNGAMYLDICLMENRDGTDQYGNDYMVVQSVSKEEREAGRRGAILGNAKNLQKRSEPPQQRRPMTTTPNEPAKNAASDEEDSNIPF